ncbi:MAG: IS3 family transposase [Pyrinomonadaceae bacterium]|nr:IS3 family transposase [Pyrinomonadaceae bacterium]
MGEKQFHYVTKLSDTCLCRVMPVERCNYYAYERGETYRENPQTARIKECFHANARCYGSRRIAASLKLGRNTVRQVMRREGLRAIAPKRFKPQTTDSRHGLGANDNLLKNRSNEPTAKGAVLVGDITYLPMQDGSFCYLACLQDKYTRRIVGWKVSTRMTAQLVIDVFLQALLKGLIGEGAIIHTDQGSHYAAVEYRRLLYTGGFRQSMSRRGNCYDNARAESFFSRFKAELLENGRFENLEQARSEIFSYIEGYYNRERLHSSLGYKSPMAFEKELKTRDKIKKQRSSESSVYR